MIAGDAKIEDREIINEKYREDLCKGDEQPAFFMEIVGAMDDDWNEGPIEDWDQQSAEGKPNHRNRHRIEHIAAFALQRDVNYLYNQHVRLKAYGYHKKFRTHFMPHYFALKANMRDIVEIAEPAYEQLPDERE